MADPRITFVETGTSTTKTLDFPNPPSKYSGGRAGDQSMSITEGSTPVTVAHGSFYQFDVEFLAIKADDDPDFWSTLWAWWSHCFRGGEFTWALDNTLTVSDGAAGAKTASDNNIVISDATNVTTGDWMHIEHGTNPSIFERQKVLTVDYGTETITFENNLHNSYPIGSAVRHEDYFPQCVLLDKKPPMLEREAGKGNRLWDVKFRLRTVV